MIDVKKLNCHRDGFLYLLVLLVIHGGTIITEGLFLGHHRHKCGGALPCPVLLPPPSSRSPDKKANLLHLFVRSSGRVTSDFDMSECSVGRGRKLCWRGVRVSSLCAFYLLRKRKRKPLSIFCAKHVQKKAGRQLIGVIEFTFITGVVLQPRIKCTLWAPKLSWQSS